MPPDKAGPQIIGQSLNVCYRGIREAAARREGGRIAALARRQAELGAFALDLCCAGCDDEKGALIWMAQTVQEAVDWPLCLDSASADVLMAAAAVCTRPPIINAVSMNHVRAGATADIAMLPALYWIVSAFDPDQSDHSPEARLQTAINVADSLSVVPESRMILDPLFLPSVTHAYAWADSCAVARLFRERFPEAGVLCAVGNVSFGADNRGKVEQDIVELAINFGFDWLLCDVARV